MEKIEKLASQITALPHDIRAEVIVNDLLKSKDINDHEYVVYKEGQFKRAYRYDVLDAGIIDYDFDATQVLKLVLSRDSLYDMFPENITHATVNDTPGKEVDSMIREFQIQKQQQKAARQFFSPFENEFFSHGVQIEGFERDFLTDLNGHLVPDMFYTFWGISKELPPLLISKFIRILPFAYKIVGNIELAGQILATLLEEKVTITKNNYQQYSDEKESISLGNARLGLDLITGSSYDDYSNHFNIKIGPLEHSNFVDYIHEGKKKKFIDLFYEYFFPIDVELETTILLPKEAETFEFSATEKPILGYNTRI